MQRKIAYELLCSSLIDGQYANLGMKQRLRELDKIQRPFVTELVNGVLRHYLLLVYQSNNNIKTKISKNVEIILAMAAFEKYYLKEKEYAITNEYVSLGKSKSEKAVLNAILRKLPEELIYPDPSDDEGLSITYSMPLWLFKMIKAQYPKEVYAKYITNSLKTSKLFYRLNTKLATFDDLKELDIEVLDHNIFTSNSNLIHHELFKKGYFYIQDYNSSHIVDYLDLKADTKFLDVCSAPGSKLFNALEVVKEENAYANDLHAHRLELIKSRAKSLGYENINYLNMDASVKCDELVDSFDRILIDAPCSGLGVLKRKADLKYHINPSDIDDIVKIQKEILNTCKDYLKVGGILVYSTCTINTKENARQIQNFIKDNPNFEVLEDAMLEKREDSDYFYVCKLLKKG